LNTGTLVISIGLVFVIEGFFPLFFPKLWQNSIKLFLSRDLGQLKTYGLILFVLGLVLIYSGVNIL
jgi:uncharacterized protein YjeT (DUF2065 family)